MKIKLLAIDMDGTALCDDHATISDENRAAIEKAIAKGVNVLTATGRVKGRVPEQMSAIPGQHYLITSNGAVLTDLVNNKTLYSNLIPLKTALQVMDALDGLDIYKEAYCNGECYTEFKKAHMVEQFPVPPWRCAMLAHGRKMVDDLRCHIQTEGVTLEKINLPFLPVDVQEEIRFRLNQISGISLTSSVEHNIEINSEATTKAKALAYLCELLGVSPEETMAMGDGGNDVEMLEFAGCSIAPANAGDLIRKTARYTTHATNNESAVAEAINQFIL